jgi:hypothetical protein
MSIKRRRRHMKRNLSALLLLVLTATLLLSGCATTFKAANGKLSYGDIEGKSRGSFSAKANAVSILSPYLFPISKPNESLDKMIEPELAAKGANAASDVQVKYGFDFLGLVISSLTCGILNWGYVSVSGNALAR